ncbi:MAG TPA: fasciclin domain-containing protein [Chitinophagaceae bacterium]|nr:fasciclin domain-containing protein [Chitinophagaceae bacterium]
MKLKSLMSVLFFSVIAVTISSCDKEDDNSPAAPGTITTQVVAGANLSLLESAVVKANLATTLDGAGPFTVFAPTDEAFAASGITASTINTLTAAQLQSILLYHTLPAEVFAANVPAGPNAKVTTASGDSVFVTKNASGVYVNGINVTQADIDASNGVIHLISRVLLPPAGNIVEVAQANSNFTFLVAAVLRASTGTTNVAQILSSGGPFTVFAPTNDAFIAAGFANIAAINAADPNTLASILTYHVVPGRVFSSDLTNGATPATANGATVTIGVSAGGATVKGKTNTTASNIIGTNVMARNGVVHVIDRVLLP